MQEFRLPLMTIGKFTFNVTAIVGIDWSEYLNLDIEEKNWIPQITLSLIGGTEYTFEGDEAHAFKQWFDQVTGQSRITLPRIADMGEVIKSD